MKKILTILLLCLSVSLMQAQITIGGNVYGGGNAGDVQGNATVTVYEGDELNQVFGGARMADVGGRTFVHVDGEKMSSDIIIDAVYGGNDIAGKIGESVEETDAIPAAIKDEVTNNITETADKNTKKYSAFILTTPERTAGTGETQSHIFIGKLYGGGNGDYTYTKDGNVHTVTDITDNTKVLATITSEDDDIKPLLKKTYVDIHGGTFGYIYGGGNNATITQNTDICIDNASTRTKTKVDVDGATNGLAKLDAARLKKMGINLNFFHKDELHNIVGDKYPLMARVFGGNNSAEMSIHPTWHLKQGSIQNLYSGGNQGAMTNSYGLLLEILDGSNIIVENVYGGCRMADVRPLISGTIAGGDAQDQTDPKEIQLPSTLPSGQSNPYSFPDGFAVRVVITGGKIHNVYGGNDVTGRVYGGNAIGIRTSISGDVYGGGNGSYAYTDQSTLVANTAANEENRLLYGDFYYDPDRVFSKAGVTPPSGDNAKYKSVEALNLFRPNAEQVSIRVVGAADKPTIVGGSIYCGGNSATLSSTKINPDVHLKIGSYVYADRVFLGNNGANMVTSNVLSKYADNSFSSLTLTDKDVFAKYMEGAAMSLIPKIVTDDASEYVDYSTKIGSLFLGGNVGSMTYPGTNTMNFKTPIIIYNKVVGGCNTADVEASQYNAAYEGGILGSSAEQLSYLDSNSKIKDRLVMNFEGLKFEPRRWKDPSNKIDPANNWVWNTVSNELDANNKVIEIDNSTLTPVDPANGTTAIDREDLRLYGGNVYGGCYESGHVNGNVVINIKKSIVNREEVFAVATTTPKTGTWPDGYVPKLYDEKNYTITTPNSGVILDEQGMDVLGSALNVFGGGYGKDSEIWGSATINLNKGYAFQIFGGGEAGVIGKTSDTNTDQAHRDEAYSTYINLNGTVAGVARGATGDSPDMAEAEFIYGGGFEGKILGSTHVHLGNGRIFNLFSGSCNADILGHTETYVGSWTVHGSNPATTATGFPWVRDHIYGGNDLGGLIRSEVDFSPKINTAVKGMVYSADCPKASSYMEYSQGRVEYIYGGCFGDYEYETDSRLIPYAFEIYNGSDNHTTGKKNFKPYMRNAFVHFKPIANSKSSVLKVFGAGEGASIAEDPGRDGDKLQDRSYVLVDFPQTITQFQTTEVFGAGAYDGLGMRYTPTQAKALDNTNNNLVNNLEKVSAVVDLMRGQINAAYGGSYNEGITRRTVVNVPKSSKSTLAQGELKASTIHLNKIFGGAFGTDTESPCDVYESQVNYKSEDAQASAVYGGNNSERRTVYSKVNIYSTVWSDKSQGYQGSVYGAGCGANTWSEYTEVNLEDGAKVYKVYGGGENGKVFNAESVQAYKTNNTNIPANAWMLGDYYNPANSYITNALTNLSTDPNTGSGLVRTAEMDDRGTVEASKTYTYNTNVLIKEGATVTGYAYGGGKGAESVVAGTTYIAVLGGTVEKDVYAAGEGGPVEDMLGVKSFISSSNAFVKGGTVRNVYGGGYEGSVGHHEGKIFAVRTNDVDAETHVVVGVNNENNYSTGNPAITRNVYGGGEGGSIYGKAYVTINNGQIGFRYKNNEYVPELDDAEEGDNLLDEAGNVFGGGYVVNSYTDFSDIKMFGGTVRGCLYGGGELGPIGRGSTSTNLDYAPARDWAFVNGDAKIYRGGGTSIKLYSGLVMRDVFGGGRGFDNWGGDGTKYMSEEVKATLDLSSKGYIFGSTDVRIRGGVVGTPDNLTKGYGNVYGGGNVGFVYSATGRRVKTELAEGEPALTNGLPTDGGGYYYSKWLGDTGVVDRTDCELSLDCNVVVEPYCKVKDGQSITIDNTYTAGQYVPIEEVNKLGDKNASVADWDKIDWESGVTIRNAVFAGGNVTVGSDQVYVNTATVFGNVTAALRDAYNRDLITIGTEHTGGLYGDGNLTLVDGYRELHIDNYGTDYYSTDEEIDKETYNNMSDRERAYFVLNYRYKGENAISIPASEQSPDKYPAVSISVGQRLSSDKFKEAFCFDHYHETDYPAVFKTYIKDDGTPNSTYFEELGFCSLYAGRLLNTIQRCDMVAVFGSRIVLQGARDRVPEKVDYTRYTLNRVGELSLNRSKDPNEAENAPITDNNSHGNYFGIYSKVNYLGNLTSDVFFDSARKTDSSNTDNQADGQTTYYDWKFDKKDQINRNNGTSPNKVALAAGVYLELIREESEKLDHTDWGYVTGVVELDLIDVKTGLGGGYVYARNEHGTKTWNNTWDKVNLSPYNLTARTYKRFTYDESAKKEIETSGNFVHNTKQIVDDCYPTVNAYDGEDASPAHYWYIRGRIYVYDQYISAYTGSANAYPETVSIPLTISAASHGKMTLRDVQPNLYAYKGEDGQPLGQRSIVINGITYHAGDPIDYWSYQMLNTTDQSRFVDDVYITIAECTYGTGNNAVTYPAGSVFLPGDKESPEEGTYNYLKKYALKKKLDPSDTEAVAYVHDEAQDKDVAFDFVFRPANNMAHSTGYALTFDMNNPAVWDDYYTRVGEQVTITRDDQTQYTYPDRISKEIYDGWKNNKTYQDQYIVGPTYKALKSDVFGQKKYTKGEIITKSVVNSYPEEEKFSAELKAKQASVEPAYVVTAEMTVADKHLYPGSPVYQSNYTPTEWTNMSGKVSPAKVCTSTLELSDTEYIYAGSLLSTSEYASLMTKVKTMNEYTGETADALAEKFLAAYLDDAYYVTKDGLYGGSYYDKDQSYYALDAWSSMSEADRANFRYNYDGLDLLIDETFGGEYGFKPQYDGYKPGTSVSQAIPQYDHCTPLNPINYSETQPIDFEAEFNPSSTHQAALIAQGGISYSDGDNVIDLNYYHDAMLSYIDEKGQRVDIPVNDRIKRQEYEDIPNERIHWATILVQEPGTYYVVKDPFIKGDVPYTVGQTIDKKLYDTLTPYQQQHNIATRSFDGIPTGENDDKGNPIYQKQYFYYCREEYKVGEKGEGAGFKVLGSTSTTNDYEVGETVEQGTLIDGDNYKKLKNLQMGFTIYGTAPIETSTLYVSRESDIYNLSKEKIITVIYMYEYQESDESGTNITPISERHIVNIHINFESGVPKIGPLTDPSVVLPGTTVGLKLPTVEPGAFEITSSGWEIFSNEEDAKLHNNGLPYVNNDTPMYWYQNGYWVAYYAQTYLGKTYSNAVQFSVANYHDLKKVMDAKEHHYYIDHDDAHKRDPKIYINDYSSSSENGLDLLKNLYDLSLLNPAPAALDENGLISSGTFAGHKPLDEIVKGGQHLDFILRTDIEHTGTWTPIGDTECFGGSLHGDGHTISGLDHSLFNKLCGDVFNLGVKGEFASTGNDIADAGIAETGSGYVENCWVYNSSTGTKTSKPVFNNPTGGDGNRPYRIVNCYYQEEDDAANKYTNHTGSYGIPTRMTAKSFFNGEVAYDLNGFYLYKRYCDNNDMGEGAPDYLYWKPGETTPQTAYYGDGTDAALSSAASTRSYVEHRIEDGDFIYANGTLPEEADVRRYTDPDTGESTYYPIWPDDYLFFGQMLTYGYDDRHAHDDAPSSIVKDANGRLLSTDATNRVYRAPAYFRSKVMGVAHYNPDADLAASEKNGTRAAYPGMTAIDFSGGNGDLAGGYKKGVNNGFFYQPLLDNDGLIGISNRDETKNLLVYVPVPTDAGDTPADMTWTVVYENQREPDYLETDADYRTVAENSEDVNYHVVEQTEDAEYPYQSYYDHFLVDKEEFNAPIAYTFTDNKRMWYQRTPERYIDIEWSGTPLTRSTKGWEAVSLPFSAELVTTDDKGEITHFFSDSKTGHEYWLREYNGKKTETEDTFTALVNYLSATDDKTDAMDKEVTNTFLWDWYYQHTGPHYHLDANKDTYQTYYKDSRNYYGYPMLTKATPYIIGFPGERYYEFDLSGEWAAKTTAVSSDLTTDQQIITFASAPNVTIRVSDDEMAGVTKDGYTFKPNYLKKEIAEGYLLNDAGNSFDKQTDVVAVPFRPYFLAASATGGNAKRRIAERIIFDREESTFTFDDNDPTQGEAGGELVFYTKKLLVGVESSLRNAVDVQIINTGGLTIASFTIQPGENIETPVPDTGVYIIRAMGGKYNRKVTVK